MSTVAISEHEDTRSVAGTTLATPEVPRPTGSLPATGPALAISIVLIAVGVAAIREAVVTLGWAAGEPWATNVLEALSTGVEPSTPLIVVGALLALLGLWFLLRAFGRRPRRDLGLGGDSHAWIAPRPSLRPSAPRCVTGFVTPSSTSNRRRVSPCASQPWGVRHDSCNHPLRPLRDGPRGPRPARDRRTVHRLVARPGPGTGC
ncbi:hypothetical protein JNB_10949 [Janibacter sp. HTCC2649]|uniref:hypothetical protein n=1 Tax=Janibacter sp. HTCC2649 TaxID=313589 RepID=UPI0000670936|nr:hypothetical protein [Janibacter sp. HTCC2649]EAQ00687.1 hypothetical protein JNB_10949 [Janibacter sp. HTCC2649]